MTHREHIKYAEKITKTAANLNRMTQMSGKEEKKNRMKTA